MTHPPDEAQLSARFAPVADLGTTRLTHVSRVVVRADGTSALLHRLRSDAAGVAPLVTLFAALYPAGERHPLWLQVHEHGTLDGTPFALTEDLDGQVLRRLLPMPPLPAIRCIRRICDALTVTDGPMPPISSRNLFQLADGRLKWAENWQYAPQAVAADLTYYQAPELRRGVAPTATTAVYGLGMLLYELLTAQRPPAGPGERRLPSLRTHQPQYLLPELERIITVATAPLPGARFADPVALQAALQQIETAAERPTQRLQLSDSAAGRRRSASHTAPAEIPPVTPRPAVPPAVTVDGDWRRRNRAVQLQSSLLLISLLVLVVACSFAFAVQLVARISDGGVWPGASRAAVQFGRADDAAAAAGTVYSVNIAEGLNLRREPGALDRASIVAVLPNGAMVSALEGPRLIDSVDWLRVRAEHEGRIVEGWMALRFLQAQP
jgi:hypothetical protein